MKTTRRSALTLMGGASLLAMPYVRRARADDGVVHIYNWTDYIGETTLEDFEKATGIKPVYDTYDSTEAMEAKMLAGSTGYDVVIQAGSTARTLRRSQGLPAARQVQIAATCPISIPTS